MTIEDTEVIDIIAVEERTGDVVLTIVDHLEWDDDVHEHLHLLQSKINSYLRFIESDEIETEYPDSLGRRRVIQVIFQFEPNPEAISFLEAVETQLSTETDIGFRYEVHE